MSRELRFRVRRLATALIPPLCMLLVACGGGGTGPSAVASIPPPPPPPGVTTTSVEVHKSWLDSPATRAGSYDLIGRLTLTPGNGNPTTYRAVPLGEFSMTTSNSLAYTLSAPAGLLPGELSSISSAIPDQS